MKFIVKKFFFLFRKLSVPLLLLLYGWKHGLNKDLYIKNFTYYKRLLQCVLFQKIFRINSGIPWPVHFTSKVVRSQNIQFDKQYVMNFLSAGCYWQALSPIIFKGSFLVAQGVGFVAQNHDPQNITQHIDLEKPIIIGENCLFSYNCVILPGVELGENTIVAAGAVVNKSFPQGNCIIGGVPARIIKELDRNEIVRATSKDLWK